MEGYGVVRSKRSYTFDRSFKFQQLSNAADFRHLLNQAGYEPGDRSIAQ